jgi:hypothetical protein
LPKGIKLCKKCGHGTGPKALICPECREPFEPRGYVHKKAAPQERKENAASKYIVPELYRGMIGAGTVVVYTPGGKCPIPLRSTETESIADWCHDIRLLGLKQRKFYTSEALAYWANRQTGLTPETDDGELIRLEILENIPNLRLEVTV